MECKNQDNELFSVLYLMGFILTQRCTSATGYELKALQAVLSSLLQTFSGSGQRSLTKALSLFNFDKDYIC
jgi:hypothetical protein